MTCTVYAYKDFECTFDALFVCCLSRYLLIPLVLDDSGCRPLTHTLGYKIIHVVKLEHVNHINIVCCHFSAEGAEAPLQKTRSSNSLDDLKNKSVSYLILSLIK